MSAEKVDAVKVAVRIRPLLQREQQDGRICMWVAKDKSLHQRDETNPVYTFDCVYDENCTTYEINDEISSPIVQAAMKGFHGTVFAYGQSGSGKTYSMSGDKMSPGLIALATDEIFQYVEQTPNREFLLRLTYMEIYQEKISDLLSSEEKNIKIQEDADHQINVIGLVEESVTSVDDVLYVVKEGDNRRKTAATKQNDRSSRSHSILRFIIESRDTGEDDAVMVSHLNFVDLAGSEKAGDNTGKVLKEGCAINKSLLSLSQVICKLSEGESDSYIGYRDSKLTRILQNALGGNSKTAIICTVSPTTIEESHSTLRFASRAKKIKNKPHLNEVLNSDAALLKRLRGEIQRLQKTASEMGVNDMLIEKDELSRQLKEKEQIENKQQRLIEKLQRMISVSSSKSDSSNTIHKKKKLRRETWCGPKLNHQNNLPVNNSILSVRDMDLSVFELHRSAASKVKFKEKDADESDFTILSENGDFSMACTRRSSEENDHEKDAMRLQIKEMEKMISQLNRQYNQKDEELKELQEFTRLEKNIMEEDLKEKIQKATNSMENELIKQNQYVSQVEAELYKITDERTKVSKQLKEKAEELKSLKQKTEKNCQDSDKQNKLNQDYITMLERQVEQSEAKLRNIDNVRHSTGQFLYGKNKMENDKEKHLLADQVEKLQKQIEDKNYEMDTLKMENIELTKQQAMAREYRLKLEEMKSSSGNNDENSLENPEMLNTYRARVEELEAELELKNKALNTIDLESSHFVSSDVSEYMVKINELESDLKESQNQLSIKSERLAQLETDVVDCKNQITVLESDIVEKSKALEAVDLENMDWSNNEVSTLKSQVKTLEVCLTEKKKENSDIKEELMKVQEEFTSKIMDLTAQYENKTRDCEALNVEISASSPNTSDQLKEIDNLKETIVQLKQQLSSFQSEEGKHENLENDSYTTDFPHGMSDFIHKSDALSLQDELNQCPKSPALEMHGGQETMNCAVSLNEELLQKRIKSLEEELKEALIQIEQFPTKGTNGENLSIPALELQEKLCEDTEEKVETKLSEDHEPIISLNKIILELNKTLENVTKGEIKVFNRIIGEKEIQNLKTELEELVVKYTTISDSAESKVQEECPSEILNKKEEEIKLLKQELENAKYTMVEKTCVETKDAEIVELRQEIETFKKNHVDDHENRQKNEETSIRETVKETKQKETQCEPIPDTTNGVMKLEEEIHLFKDHIDDLKCLVEEQKSEIEGLKGQLRVSSEKKAAQEETIVSLNAAIAELEENASSSIDVLETMKSELETSGKEILELKSKSERVSELYSRIQELQVEFDAKDAELKKTQSNLDIANSREEIIANLKSKLVEMETEMKEKDELVMSCTRDLEEASDLREQKKTLKYELEMMEREFNEKADNLSKTSTKLSEVLKDLEETQQEVCDLQEIVERETDENTENKEKISAYQEQISKQRIALEEMEGELRQVSLREEKIKQDYQTLKEDNDDLLSWYEKQQEEDKIKAAEKDCESMLKEQLSNLQQEIRTKREEMNQKEQKYKQDLTDKCEQLNSVQGEVKILMDELNSLHNLKLELSETNREKEELQQDIKDNIAQIAILQLDSEEKIQTIKVLKEENKEVEKLKVDIANNLDTIKSLQNTEKQLKSNLESAEEKLQQEKQIIQQFQEEKSALQDEISEYSETLKQLKENPKYKELELEIERLKTELSTREKEIFEYKSEEISTNKLKEEIRTLEDDLSVKKNRILELEQLQRQQEIQISEFSGHINKTSDRLKTELEDEKAKNDKLQEQINQLESGLSVEEIKEESTLAVPSQSVINEKVTQLEQELQAQKEKFVEMKSAWKEEEIQMKRDKFSLRVQLKDTRRDNERLNLGFDAFEMKVEELNKEIDQLTREKETWEDNLKKKQEKWAGLSDENASMFREIHQLKYSLEKKQMEFERKERVLEDTVEYKESVITRLKDQLRRQTSDLDTTSSDVNVDKAEHVEHVLVDVGTSSGVIDKYTVCLVESENKRLMEDKILLKKSLDEVKAENELLHSKLKKMAKDKKKEAMIIADSAKENVNTADNNGDVCKKRKVTEESDTANETVDESFNFNMNVFNHSPGCLFKRRDEMKKKNAVTDYSDADVAGCKSQ